MRFGRLVLFFGASVAAARGLGADRLTVATYNVDNYGPAGRRTPEGYRPDYPKPEDEKRALRTAIRALGADVLALQEMGGPESLEELRADLESEGLAYPHAALLEGSDPDRRVAVLSKRVLVRTVLWPEIRLAAGSGGGIVKRGLLEARVATGGGPVSIFVVHLKSRLTERIEDPESARRRAAEAGAVRDAILSEVAGGSGGRYVIVGDCNDPAGSSTLRRLEKRGETVVAVRLPAADSRGEEWTQCWKAWGAYSQFDHILVSPALLPRVAGGAARIYDGAGSASASDHRPVEASFDLGPAGEGQRPETVTGIVTELPP